MDLSEIIGFTGKLKAEVWCRWLLVVLTGFAAAAMSFSINAGIEAMDKLRYSAAVKYIHPGGKSRTLMAPTTELVLLVHTHAATLLDER